MKETEVMRLMKGGCLQSPSLAVKAISYALVLNPDRENLCPFRVDNSSVYPNIRTEDKPHASLCGIKFLSHSFKGFVVTGMPPVSLLRSCNKKPRV